jgi:hypothetical protein
LLLLSFPTTFSYHLLCHGSSSDTNYAWRPSTMTTRVSLLFSIRITSLLRCYVTPTSSIITLLFLSRLNKMATDIGSLAAGLDGHMVRLGIGRKGLRRQGGTRALTFPL